MVKLLAQGRAKSWAFAKLAKTFKRVEQHPTHIIFRAGSGQILDSKARAQELGSHKIKPTPGNTMAYYTVTPVRTRAQYIYRLG